MFRVWVRLSVRIDGLDVQRNDAVIGEPSGLLRRQRFLMTAPGESVGVLAGDRVFARARMRRETTALMEKAAATARVR